MIPLIVDRSERQRDAEVLCKFEWITEEGESAEDEKKRAEAAEVRLRSGQTSVNEERAEHGRPTVEGGDVVRIESGLVPVGAADDTDDSPDSADGNPDGTNNPSPSKGDGEVSDDDVDAMSPTDGDSPDEDRAELLERLRADAVLGLKRSLYFRSLLPSEWQPTGPFADVRTLALDALGRVVRGYRRAVDPLWATARSEVVAATGAASRRDGIGDPTYLSAVAASMTKLRESWSLATMPLYLEAGNIGARGGRRIAGDQSLVPNEEERSKQYHEQAMAWLNDLISDVSTRVLANVEAFIATRAPQKAESFDAESDLGVLLAAVEYSFDANEYRVDNWSGRLIELANALTAAALLDAAASSEAVDGPEVTVVEGEGEPLEGEEPADRDWWVSWEYVGDERTCETCEREGALPIRPLRTLSTVPGGQTECRARCRCVLVYWTADEVQDGTAEKIIT